MNLRTKERGVSRLYAVDRHLKPRHEQSIQLFRKWAGETSLRLHRNLGKPVPVKLRSEDIKAHRDRQIREALCTGLGKVARHPVEKHFTAAPTQAIHPFPKTFDRDSDYWSVRKGKYVFAIKMESHFARYYPEKEMLHFGAIGPQWRTDEYIDQLQKNFKRPTFGLHLLAIPVYTETDSYRNIPFHDHLVDNLLYQGQCLDANLLYFWRNIAQRQWKTKNSVSGVPEVHICGLLLLAGITGAPERAAQGVEQSLGRIFTLFPNQWSADRRGKASLAGERYLLSDSRRK